MLNNDFGPRVKEKKIIAVSTTKRRYLILCQYSLFRIKYNPRPTRTKTMELLWIFAKAANIINDRRYLSFIMK